MKIKILLLLIFCLPVLSNAQNCIGTAGQIKWSYWSAGFTAIPDSNALKANEFFPTKPDGFEILASTASPINYTDNFGSQMKGFIKVNQTDTYLFNVTGDDKVIFYLSPNEDPNLKVRRASVPSNVGATSYNTFPEQTSIPIQLIAGQYYYFEVLNFEGGGSDFMTLFWRKQAVSTWTIIDFNNLWQFSCESTCPPRGTICNDGNSLTTNDMQDGFCNCVGTAPTTNACVGTRGVSEAYYYDNITGSYVENDLLNSPKFPLVPDRKESLKGLFGPLAQSTKDLYGTLVQGFLTVPVSGIYEFNLTGDNQTFFYLSKNDSIEYKQNHQMIVIGGIGEYEHNQSSFQNSGPILLEKGKYYYYEFRHKENTWRDHFHLFWKTPFHTPKTWKKIPNFYLFDYDCEISCIAQNTPCDDGNPFTNNDKIDAFCECAGTPCSGPDCIDLGAAYKLYDDCKATDNLNPISEASWVSCNSSANPNTERSNSTHWIKYNFEDIYKFKNSRVWNYNVTNETNKGFNQVVVDYSLDGTTWTPLGGVYNWPQASGTADYAGFIGPNFNDIKAKFILVSAINNHGDAGCSGFSKITFDAQMCNPKDTPCNDGDPLTQYDKFDANCNCKGIDINCGSDTLMISVGNLANGAFMAKKRIEALSTVPNTQNISFTAGNSIVLLPGFEVKNEAIFSAKIEDCIQAQFTANAVASESNKLENEKLVSDFENSDTMKKIVFRLNEAGDVKLQLKDSNGRVIVLLIDEYQENLGTQTKLIPTTKLKKGRYEIELIINKNKVSEFFEVE